MKAIKILVTCSTLCLTGFTASVNAHQWQHHGSSTHHDGNGVTHTDWQTHTITHHSPGHFSEDKTRSSNSFGVHFNAAPNGLMQAFSQIISNNRQPAQDHNHRRAHHRWQRKSLRWINAGPIWNQNDAQSKCPGTCKNKNRRWNGQWRTTQANVQSVCQCQL